MLRVFRAKRRSFVIWLFVIVAFFLGGFIIIPGSGLDSQSGSQDGRVLGKVEGIPITRVDFDLALAGQQQNYKNQIGEDPAERDIKALEVQAWRSLVSQHLLADQARDLGFKAHDAEVTLTLRTSPPQQITSISAFQTDGRFDPSKYQAALNDPNINWAPFEELVRSQLPVRKLQERMLSAVKMSEPELRQAYRDRFERYAVTVVRVPPAAEATPPTPTEADLERVYARHKDRLTFPPRAQLEVMLIPREYGDAGVREAEALAQSLADRVRGGEDFASLARDYSEGGGAARGGEVPQVLRLQEFGPVAGPQVAALEPEQITSPIRDGGRFLVFKLLEKTLIPGSGEPGYRVAQIVIRIRPDDEVVRAQYAEMTKLRKRADRIGLGKAASEIGYVTARTDYFTAANTPAELFTVPAAADWGLNAKKGEVGPVFEGTDDFALVEVVDVRSGGPAPLEEVRAQVRAAFEQEHRVEAAKPIADTVAASLASGQTLEHAARLAGAEITPLAGISRLQLDPPLDTAPEVAGAIFATAEGQRVGPIQALGGWFFARVDRVTAADPELYDQVKGQISSDMLQRRQTTFLNTYLTEMRLQANIKDERFPK